MTKFVILAAIVLILKSADGLLNGVPAPIVEYAPYFARITFRKVGETEQVIFEKAGTIISDRFVLTTGLFFETAFDFRVYVGSNLRTLQQMYRVTGAMRVSDHSDGPALLQLAVPLWITTSVKSIRIVPYNRVVGLQNEQGTIVGMGGNTEATRATIHAAFMRIVSVGLCTTNYPARNSSYYFCAIDNARASDFCGEDRGTALTISSRGEEFLVGLAIDGVCNPILHNRPSLFANVAAFRDRINNIIQNFN